ncbi:hypothetical protein ACLB2K_049447 [Fragaria x ananassa]
MAQNLLRLRRSVATIHRALSATSSLPSVPRSSPYTSSAVVQPSPSFQIQFQSRSFRSSSISFARPNSSPGNYNQNEEIGPDTILFEGCDYNHWLVVMDFPKDNKPPPQEMVRTYEETCARGLNISVEEAKKKIYACSTTTYTGFHVLMSEEESDKFNGLPGVIFVLPDSYIDPQNKEYGGDKYDNGVITHRPPPFQYERQGSRYRDRNRYNRPMPYEQGNSSYGQPGSPQGGGNYRASQPGSPQQAYGPPGQGENRGGSYGQGPSAGTAGSYGQGPSGGSYGQGPSGGSYGQGPSAGSAGSYGQGLSAGTAGSYGQGPSAGTAGTAGSYGQGPSGGSYGQGPSAGSYGQGSSDGSAGSYGQGPSAGSAASYGQGPSAGSYGQGPSAGSYGQGPIAGGYGEGPSSGYPGPGNQNFTQGEPRSMQGEQTNYAPHRTDRN